MHNTASTSIENYHFKIKGEHEDKENEIILDAVKKLQPCTGRMIWKYLNGIIENSSVARSLNNLKKKEVIVSPFKDKCQITDIKAQYYTLIEQGQTLMF